MAQQKPDITGEEYPQLSTGKKAYFINNIAYQEIQEYRKLL